MPLSTITAQPQGTSLRSFSAWLFVPANANTKVLPIYYSGYSAGCGGNELTFGVYSNNAPWVGMCATFDYTGPSMANCVKPAIWTYIAVTCTFSVSHGWLLRALRKQMESLVAQAAGVVVVAPLTRYVALLSCMQITRTSPGRR